MVYVLVEDAKDLRFEVKMSVYHDVGVQIMAEKERYELVQQIALMWILLRILRTFHHNQRAPLKMNEILDNICSRRSRM